MPDKRTLAPRKGQSNARWNFHGLVPFGKGGPVMKACWGGVAIGYQTMESWGCLEPVGLETSQSVEGWGRVAWRGTQGVPRGSKRRLKQPPAFHGQPALVT